MKRSRLSYDEWTCIVSKNIFGKTVNSKLLNGYIGLMEIKEVNKAQVWKFNGKDIVVCDKGRKWLSILPNNDWYCITAMMDEDEKILLWYNIDRYYTCAERSECASRNVPCLKDMVHRYDSGTRN